MTDQLVGEPFAGRRTRILDHLDRRNPGHSLPGALYTDPDVFASELDLLWRRRWLFVGTVAEVPEPGDYFSFDVAGSSVLVIRDDDEQVRAFHNVCRHRGSRLVAPGHGSVGNLVCGYHSWTYATDGSLRHAPQLSPAIDTACLGLRPVALREVGGLLYCSLAAEPDGDLDVVAERVRDYLTPHRLDRAKVAAQVDLVEEGNWKLVMENNRECYHCATGHPELICTFFPTWGLREDQVPDRLRADHDRYLFAEADLARRCDALGMPYALIEELADRPFGFRIQREPLDGAGESFSIDGSRLVGRLLGDLDDPQLGRCTLHTQPNAWIHLLADHVVTFSVTPISPDRTLVRSTWLVHEDAVEGVDYDVETLTAVWRATNEQDAELVRNTQLGVSDPAYVPGPYNEAERQVDDFVRWYDAQIRSEANTEGSSR